MFSFKSVFYISFWAAMLMPHSVIAETVNDTVVVSAGYQYSQGKYQQQQDTIIHYFPVSVLYGRDKWQVGLTVPYIVVVGSGNVIPGTNGSMFFGGANSGGFGMGNGAGNNNSTSVESTTNSGMGDVFARATYSLNNFSSENVFYVLETNIKLATADASQGLGTGENDYAIQLNSSYGASHRSHLSLGYKIMGDSANINYNNIFYGTAGISFKMAGTKRFGISFDYQQATVDGLDDFQQMNFSFSWVQDNKQTISLGALAGLTDSSPDFGASIYISNNF